MKLKFFCFKKKFFILFFFFFFFFFKNLKKKKKKKKKKKLSVKIWSKCSIIIAEWDKITINW
ncbi:hypothetical protein DR096_01910 [Mycoplasma hyopneumoniae]|nr:hypothetical protein [Mesomycoplasma hyopneumoniae]